jgi:hypothetical protein
MTKPLGFHEIERRHHDIGVAVCGALASVFLLAGCGSGDDKQPADGGNDLEIDMPAVPYDGAKDVPIADLGPEALVTSDGALCPSPKVWRYEQPGCGIDAPAPICGNPGGDACLSFVCGCDGEVLTGCDYFDRPWQARGLCPGACYTPTHNLEAVLSSPGLIKGCACDPAVDRGQCITVAGQQHPMTCVLGTWSYDRTGNCDALDGGSGPIDGTPDAPVIDGPTSDGNACLAPNVWRYEQPGCGPDAPPPICGNGMQDACPGWACGCDGEVIGGCDYFSKPWSARGFCPGACFSPTHNVDAALESLMPGCPCNPATDQGQCVGGTEGHPNNHYNMVCTNGAWKFDFTSPCIFLDAAPPGPGPTVDPPTVDGSAHVD